jgi:hypothetical protein
MLCNNGADHRGSPPEESGPRRSPGVGMLPRPGPLNSFAGSVEQVRDHGIFHAGRIDRLVVNHVDYHQPAVLRTAGPFGQAKKARRPGRFVPHGPSDVFQLVTRRGLRSNGKHEEKNNGNDNQRISTGARNFISM